MAPEALSRAHHLMTAYRVALRVFTAVYALLVYKPCTKVSPFQTSWWSDIRWKTVSMADSQ